MSDTVRNRESESGSAGLKFMIVVVVIGLVAHASYNYVPVAYTAESVKSDMYMAVLQGMAMPGKVNIPENVKTRIQKSCTVNGVPADAVLDVKMAGTNLTARLAYVQQVDLLPFGLYRYNYTFDHTATPTGFLFKD